MSYTLTTYGGTSVQVVTPSTGLSAAGAALNDNFEFLVDHAFLPGASVSDGSGNSVTVCNGTWAILAYCANNGVYISAAATITPLQCYCNTESGRGGSAVYFTDDVGNTASLCTGVWGLQIFGSTSLDGGQISTDGSGDLTVAGTSTLDNGAISTDGSGKVTAAKLNLYSLPTSSSGLSTGDVWNDSGTLKIV